MLKKEINTYHLTSMFNFPQVFVACVTKKYTESSYCEKEISLAFELKRKIVPLLFEKVKPRDEKMALYFTGIKYLNCHEGLTVENLPKIVDNIKSKAQ